MKLKKYEGLSSYLIDEEGGVFNMDGSMVDTITKKLSGYIHKTETFYKLKTDEILTPDFANPICIYRRYNREDIIKMYNSPKSFSTKEISKLFDTPDKILFKPLKADVWIEEAGEVTKEQFDHLKTKKEKLDVMVVGIGKGKASGFFAKSIIGIENKLAKHKKNAVKAKKVQPVKSKYVKKGEDVEEAAIEIGMKMLELKANASEKGYFEPVTNEVVAHIADHIEVGLPYCLINNVAYRSARKAAKDLKISVNTVLKRCKENKDGYFYIEK